MLNITLTFLSPSLIPLIPTQRHQTSRSSHATTLCTPSPLSPLTIQLAREASRKYPSPSPSTSPTPPSAACTIQNISIPPTPFHINHPPSQTITQLTNHFQSQHPNLPPPSFHPILSALRIWISQISDIAHQSSNPFSLDALLILLQLAGFSLFPNLPPLTPPSPEALTLGNSIETSLDPTLLQSSNIANGHVTHHGISIGAPTYYPHVAIATRGVTVVSNKGLLLSQKLRALERTYFAWLPNPFVFLFHNPSTAIRTFFINRFTKSKAENNGTNTQSPQLSNTHNSHHFIRRIVPAVKLKRSWKSLHTLLEPTITQEPAHQFFFLMYRPIKRDLQALRQQQRQAFYHQLRNSVSQAVNPIPPGRKPKPVSNPLSSFQKPIGETLPLELHLYKQVAWGLVSHFLPCTFVLPAISDLLRIDALTFVGLVSAGVTYLRQSDSVLIYVSLLISFVTYSVRVGLGLRQALLAYNAKIAKDREQCLIARDEGVIDVLARLAVEVQFVNVASVWLGEENGGVQVSEEGKRLWREWLRERGLLKGGVRKE